MIYRNAQQISVEIQFQTDHYFLFHNLVFKSLKLNIRNIENKKKKNGRPFDLIDTVDNASIDVCQSLLHFEN